jgi:hypothetical protein
MVRRHSRALFQQHRSSASGSTAAVRPSMSATPPTPDVTIGHDFSDVWVVLSPMLGRAQHTRKSNRAVGGLTVFLKVVWRAFASKSICQGEAHCGAVGLRRPRRPCPGEDVTHRWMLMARRKIIAQMMIGNETRPIKAKLRNASCLWDTHQGKLWVLDFIRRSPPCPRSIVQHDCENVNDQRRIHRPPQKCGLYLSKPGRTLPSRCDPISKTPSPPRIRRRDPSSDYYRG